MRKKLSKKTEEKFDASSETLAELANIHTTGFRKYLDKISQRTQVAWEKIILIFIILSIGISSYQTIFKTSFIHNSSIFVYPILILLLGITIISILKAYQIYIKKCNNLKNLRSGMNEILSLGILNILIGVFGYTFEIVTSGGHGEMFVPFLLIIINTTPPETQQMLINIVDIMLKITSMMMTCISATMITAFFWFGLMNKISKIEQAEAFFLLEG